MRFLDMSLALALALGAGTGASAAVVAFRAEAPVFSVSGATPPGIVAGTTFQIEVLADNGGGAPGGEWLDTDIISATLTSGGYVASYSGPAGSPTFVFRTDAAGLVTETAFFISAGSMTDSLGNGGIFLFDGGLTYTETVGSIVFFPGVNALRWSATEVAADVPAPAAAPLLIAALTLLGMARRRA